MEWSKISHSCDRQTERKENDNSLSLLLFMCYAWMAHSSVSIHLSFSILCTEFMDKYCAVCVCRVCVCVYLRVCRKTEGGCIDQWHFTHTNTHTHKHNTNCICYRYIRDFLSLLPILLILLLQMYNVMMRLLQKCWQKHLYKRKILSQTISSSRRYRCAIIPNWMNGIFSKKYHHAQ